MYSAQFKKRLAVFSLLNFRFLVKNIDFKPKFQRKSHTLPRQTNFLARVNFVDRSTVCAANVCVSII